MTFIANHLWQSTLFAAACGLLTLIVRRHGAHVRHGLWLAASLKFLVPFAVLVALGHQFSWRAPVRVAADFQVVINRLAGPVTGAGERVALSRVPLAQPGLWNGARVPRAAGVLWLLGVAAIVLSWAGKWRRVARTIGRGKVMMAGRELHILRRLERATGRRRMVPMVMTIPMVMTHDTMEPGVVGFLRPVLLWPAGISAHLSDDQIETIILHELSHVRRWDNLAAFLHMVVQAIFWFHPLVWWLGARLMDERERACDEDVLRRVGEPDLYARTLLQTCRLAIRSPLACVAGVTGSTLSSRIERIMRDHVADSLNGWRKSLLTAAAIAAVVIPIAAGVLSPRVVLARAQIVRANRPTFEVASVKPNTASDNKRVAIMTPPGGRLAATNVPLIMLIRFAYGLQDFQVVGAPDWTNAERFDVTAKAEGDVENPGPGTLGPIHLMLQTLLEERFKLTLRNEQRDLPIYQLIKARADGRLGPRLRLSSLECERALIAPNGAPPSPVPGQPACGIRIGPGAGPGEIALTAGGMNISQLASSLGQFVQRMITDRTGLGGKYDIDFSWSPDATTPVLAIKAGALQNQAQVTPPSGIPDSTGPTFFTALQEQLGLKLDATRGPVDVIVIDHIERPTPD